MSTKSPIEPESGAQSGKVLHAEAEQTDAEQTDAEQLAPEQLDAEQTAPEQLDATQLDADQLVRALKQAMSQVSQCQARVFELLDVIESSSAWEGWIGIRDLAHWVSYVCEVTRHTAREYIRVMRGLRQLPEVASLLAAGRISYSKAREITRVAGRIDRKEAARMVTVATAAQLSLMVSTYTRLASVPEEGYKPRRPEDRFCVVPGDDGRARIIIDLPEAEAAEVRAAIDAARDRLLREARANADKSGAAAARKQLDHQGDADDRSREQAAAMVERVSGNVESEYDPITNVDAFLEVVRAGVDSPATTAGERERSLMVVHVAPATLAAAHQVHDCTAGSLSAEDSLTSDAESPISEADEPSTSEADEPSTSEADDAPSEQLSAVESVGYIAGYGPITAATAGRLACQSTLMGALVDSSRNVLALGRKRRLATRRQRIALQIRDGFCQFPNCFRTRGLEAHHIVPWSHGGDTDMDNMVLLCRSHHISIHQHDVQIVRSAEPRAEYESIFDFFDVDGQPLHDYRTYLKRPRGDASDTSLTAAETSAVSNPLLKPVDLDHVPDAIWEPSIDPISEERTKGPERIATLGGGEGFSLDWCVWWLFEAEDRLRKAPELPPQQAA